MLIVHAEFPIDPDSREDAEALLEALIPASKAEEGMIEYRAAWDVTEPNLLRFTERYEDEAAFAHHAETEHVQELQDALPGLLAGEPQVMQFHVESASEVEF